MKMDIEPQLLDFVKAMADVERLRIIGALTRGPATASKVADELGVPFREAFEHLSFLVHIGVVGLRPSGRRQDDAYELDPAGMQKLARQRFGGSRQAYIPAPELDARSRKALAAHLNADGTIKQIPYQAGKLRVILDYLVAAFTPGVDYTEKEVNTILRRFHLDTAGLRRDLIDAGLLQRESDGSRYWRSLRSLEAKPK
jgi:hypothetical protein